MAFWDFCHDILGTHVYMLPSLLLCVIMAVTGLVHKKNQSDRQKEYTRELSGQEPENPQAAD